jgi:hypothetical protein
MLDTVTDTLSATNDAFESQSIEPTKGDGIMDPSLIISLLSGAAGGNIAGGLLKNASLGLIGNSLAGLVGGGLGGKILGGLLGVAAAKAGGGLDIGSIIGSVVSGGAGGGVLMTVIGLIRQMMAK